MTTWPPNYKAVIADRIARQERIMSLKGFEQERAIKGIKAYYANHTPELFIEDWCVTYDPRNKGGDSPKTIPFILFDRQKEFIDFVMGCLKDQESGLIEKSRDMGATWLCCALSVYLWLFVPGISIGWGSRKEMLVDRLGDPDSIFEKMRKIILSLPRWLWPDGFKPKEHSSYMKILNPESGGTITGESGDNIGRGGRKAIYFKDESAWYEHPESIEASLGDTTNCQIDISSVKGTNTVFHRRKTAGETWDKKKALPLAQYESLSSTGATIH